MEEPIHPAYRRGDQRDRQHQSDQHHSENDPANAGPQGPARDFAPELPELPQETSMSKLLEFLIPPKDDHPENIRRWRISVGLALVILFGHVTLACGWYQMLGFSGFAYASTVKEIKVELLEQRIFDTRVAQCSATTPEGKQFYGKKVRELLRKYEETAGSRYFLPTCEEIK